MPGELETEVNKLLEDESAKKLKKLLHDFNPFRVLGVETYEIRHSNTLAWLLDPTGSHNLGSAFLRKFLKSAPRKEGESTPITDWLRSSDDRNVIVHREISLPILKEQNISAAELQAEIESFQKRKKRRALDILIEGPSWRVAIEIKIRAGQSENQLDDYRKAIEKRSPEKKNYFYYLSNNLGEDIPNPWEKPTWASHILPILKELSPTDSQVDFFIRCFTSSVEEHCGEGPIADLVCNLLESYSPTLDRIKGRKLKEANEVRGIIWSNRDKRLIATKLLSRYTPSNKKRADILRSFVGSMEDFSMLNEDSSTTFLKFAMNTWLSKSWLEVPKSCGALVEIENERDEVIKFKLLIRDRGVSSQVPQAERRIQLASHIRNNSTEFNFNGDHATIWSRNLRSPKCESVADIRVFFDETVRPVLERFTRMVEEFSKTIVH